MVPLSQPVLVKRNFGSEGSRLLTGTPATEPTVRPIVNHPGNRSEAGFSIIFLYKKLTD